MRPGSSALVSELVSTVRGHSPSFALVQPLPFPSRASHVGIASLIIPDELGTLALVKSQEDRNGKATIYAPEPPRAPRSDRGHVSGCVVDRWLALVPAAQSSSVGDRSVGRWSRSPKAQRSP